MTPRANLYCLVPEKRHRGEPGHTLVPVKRHRGEPGHTRDRHKNLTNRPQNQPHPPCTDSSARPHPNPGTHAPPHTTTLTRKRGGGDGDGDGARTWEQRGRKSKKTPGGAGTHTGHTGHTGAHAGTRITRTKPVKRHGGKPGHTSCVPAPVCVPAPPGVFLPVLSTGTVGNSYR